MGRIIMKLGIFVTLAALALAVFAVPDAHAWRGHHDRPGVHQKLFAQGIVIDVEQDSEGNVDPVGNTTMGVSGIAKGLPGKADVSAVLVYKTVFEGSSGCPEELPQGGEIMRFEWGQVYSDGSLLSGFVDQAGQFLCTNGVQTGADLTGVISGGTGRFEDASGTWRVLASSPVANTNITGTLTVEFD
jgi:hypothetical protein